MWKSNFRCPTPSTRHCPRNCGNLTRWLTSTQARTLLAHDPFDEGGFVVRVTTGGDVTYVPLRGLRYSGAKPAAVANPEVTGVEWALRSGLATVGLGTTLWLASVIFKGG